MLEPSEARQLLDSLDISTPSGLRDRALIALMVFYFARIGAALAMRVEDVYTQNRRLWVRLRGKGGKRHAMPCPAITRWRPTCMPIWWKPGSRTI
ncbi:tyrosine-type recombinase/integrase [Pseudomonas sp. LS1212]|nr:tyrosine-type recombinase/integrase [Pseudomonas sp. LS1212]UVJ46556.1 tyrosine-type recombinase/integrase [Pseudomonas sp. LS1212]